MFTGDTTAHILAGVIRADIDFGQLPGTTPAPICRLLKRCLDRDVKRRLQWIGEARVVLETEAAIEQRDPVVCNLLLPLAKDLRQSSRWLALAKMLHISDAVSREETRPA